MLDQLLGGANNTIIQSLTSKLGMDSNQAGGFLQKALSLLEGGITSGKVNPTELETGNTSGILSKLDSANSRATLAATQARPARGWRPSSAMSPPP
jgi:hypothetical protein